ncbi:Cytochrome P450 [Tolypocladium paradoxum]|uniref:Cytochrome P450 n=1 Tax=Tolypocladium paradoxum TaxID=94208 RepID=A0A2S4L900_9HYPO|nr:Cytochrome P450 [Tolypocladium paradoxum]
MAFASANLLAGLGGVSAHVLVFRVGEWDVASPSVVLCHVLVFVAVALVSYTQFQVPVAEVARCSSYYIAGLYLSMLLYRAFFHRLSKYPGPFLARLTNFYITALSMKKLHLFEEVQKLHVQYGDYVRLGPSELSIADPEAVQTIYGTQSPTSKGPWYTLLEPRTPLFMARDKREHARRRKVWDQGFSTTGKPHLSHRKSALQLADSVDVLTSDSTPWAIDQLLQVIDRDHKQPINITELFNFFAFDVMEDLAFNKTSNMLRDGKEAYIFKTIREDMFHVAIFTHLPWLLPFLKRTPILNRNYLQFWDWIQAQITERSNNEPEQPDIFSWILAEYNRSEKTQLDRWNLHGDAQLIVIAGSDTTAATLTHIFFQLAYDADLVQALQKEFDGLPSLAHDNLTKVSLLDAVINETLRLYPTVPSGTQRMTPPEGLRVGEIHIPGNTIVQVPSYTVFRGTRRPFSSHISCAVWLTAYQHFFVIDSRAFEQPNDFIPERWTTRPDLIKNRSAFIPFNTGTRKGPYACVGKRLALLELRRLVAEILWRYDVCIAPGQSKEAFHDGKQDTFTLVSAPLSLVFTPRSL